MIISNLYYQMLVAVAADQWNPNKDKMRPFSIFLLTGKLNSTK